ncbi:MAG: Crp/Fnr family transcriptional regulator [Bacteroides sp.]|nr:Crp/Fnr family transcriptional regulator [Bacteroides sp.]
MVKANNKETTDLSFCKEVLEKFGERRLIGRGEYFAHSGEVIEYAGWMVSGGFKSLMSSDGNNRVIDFSLDDSLLIDNESVRHYTKMRTDIIALEDSEVIVIPTKIMRERMNRDHELNMNLMMGLFEQLYDQFLEFCIHTTAQSYLRQLDRYPRITEIASNGDIASYLNISRRQC